jgi:hypothetical protein
MKRDDGEMNALKIFTNISLIAVVGIGMRQLSSKSNSLAGQDNVLPLCCEDGDCRPGYANIPVKKCTDQVGIKEIDDNGDCGIEDPNEQCGECITRQNAMTLCKPPGHSNDYCCEIDPEPLGWYCPEQYRRYACDWLSVSISGPSWLPPGQSGTFTAD